MEIVLSAVDKGGEFPIQHDLNFHTTRYETKHTIVSQVAHEPASGNTLLTWASRLWGTDIQEPQARCSGRVEGIGTDARRRERHQENPWRRLGKEEEEG